MADPHHPLRAALDAAHAELAAPLWAELHLLLGPAWAPALQRLRASCGDSWAAQLMSRGGPAAARRLGPARELGPRPLPAAHGDRLEEALGWLVHALSDDVAAARAALALAAGDLAAAAASVEALAPDDADRPLLEALVARELGPPRRFDRALAALPPAAAARVADGAPLEVVLGEALLPWVLARSG